MAIAPKPIDPIAEAPESMWYVRPNSGGQYGPAPGEVMRKWVDEGRVVADSLVWREGWPEWKTAGLVFASLGATQASPPVMPPETSGLSPIAAVPATSVTSQRLRKRKSNVVGITAVVVLVVASVVLVGVLLAVLNS